MVRTFLDSGVLLAATRSVVCDRELARQILEDSGRTFLTSAFVHLELVPKATFHKKRLEKAFYDEYFNAAEWFRDLNEIGMAARIEAARSGLSALDALHLAAAHLAGRRVRHDRKPWKADLPLVPRQDRVSLWVIVSGSRGSSLTLGASVLSQIIIYI